MEKGEAVTEEAVEAEGAMRLQMLQWPMRFRGEAVAEAGVEAPEVRQQVVLWAGAEGIRLLGMRMDTCLTLSRFQPWRMAQPRGPTIAQRTSAAVTKSSSIRIWPTCHRRRLPMH